MKKFMKELPKHLNYAFLGAERSKTIIITADLIEEKEQKLIKILKKHKEAILISGRLERDQSFNLNA